jgi:anaphase-promoting complex subunit 10
MYLCHPIDDSYTPSRISIRAGTYHGDLVEIKLVELDKPKGWCQFPVGDSFANPGGKDT